MSIESLPDFSTLRQLSRALWRTEPEGRGAAVLVGAGFSRNAELAAADSPPPPLWEDLAHGMRRQLYDDGQSEFAPSDPLRLAEEFRAYLGQAALNDHLRESITDESWFPSSLHRDLLALPWADVLTTNYDTLLERAAQHVTRYAYQVVKTSSDLVRARSPRIIKLHGTVGDQVPLVIAEDDYRRYPQERAAFVNVARQVFIENELCLLGFSGVDPNFLAWSGWVRDHLGANHRRIFLVGVLRLAPATRRLLESRNVAPIDLAPLVEEFERHEQHAQAARELLTYLRESRPIPKHEWNLSASGLEDRGLLALAPDDALQRLDRWIQEWRLNRKSYPGWLVCNHRYRTLLRMHTSEGLTTRRSLDGTCPVWRSRTHPKKFSSLCTNGSSGLWTTGCRESYRQAATEGRGTPRSPL